MTETAGTKVGVLQTVKYFLHLGYFLWLLPTVSVFIVWGLVVLTRVSAAIGNFKKRPPDAFPNVSK